MIWSPRKTFLLAFGLVVFMVLRVSSGQVDALHRAELPNPDSYYKLVLLRDADPERGWAWSARDNAPYGFWMHWSKPHSELMQAIAGVLEGFDVAPPRALLWAGGGLTMLSMMLLAMPLLWLLAQVAGTLATLLVGMALATSIPLFGYAQLLQVTHHIFMLVPVAWALLGLHGQQTRWRDAGAGASLGLALWISPETMPLVLILTALRVAQRLINPQSPPVSSWGMAFAAVALMAYGLDPPPPSFSPWALDHISLAWLLLAVLLALVMVLIDMLAALAASTRWLLAFAAAVFAAGLWLALVPQALDGPLGVLPEALRVHWWSRIHELQPANTLSARLAYGLMPLMATLACLWVAWQQRQLWFLGLALGVGLYGIFGLMHLRMGSASAVLACYGLGVALGQLPAFRQASTTLSRRQHAVVLLLMGLIPGHVFLAQAMASSEPAVASQCSLAEAAPALNRLPQATLLVPLNHAPELLYRTHHAVIAGNYHHNRDGLHDFLALWLGLTTADDRAAIIAARDIRHVLLCPQDDAAALTNQTLRVHFTQVIEWPGGWQLLTRDLPVAYRP